MVDSFDIVVVSGTSGKKVSVAGKRRIGIYTQWNHLANVESTVVLLYNGLSTQHFVVWKECCGFRLDGRKK